MRKQTRLPLDARPGRADRGTAAALEALLSP